MIEIDTINACETGKYLTEKAAKDVSRRREECLKSAANDIVAR